MKNIEYNFYGVSNILKSLKGKTFDQVFNDFKQGKKIRRKEWGNFFIQSKFIGPSTMPILNPESLLKKDWEIVE